MEPLAQYKFIYVGDHRKSFPIPVAKYGDGQAPK